VDKRASKTGLNTEAANENTAGGEKQLQVVKRKERTSSTAQLAKRRDLPKDVATTAFKEVTLRALELTENSLRRRLAYKNCAKDKHSTEKHRSKKGKPTQNSHRARKK